MKPKKKLLDIQRILSDVHFLQQRWPNDKSDIHIWYEKGAGGREITFDNFPFDRTTTDFQVKEWLAKVENEWLKFSKDGYRLHVNVSAPIVIKIEKGGLR
jgi:hypothetical protein